jgi:hypothetical protein
MVTLDFLFLLIESEVNKKITIPCSVAESEVISEVDKVSEVLHFEFLARGELVSLHQVIKGELLKIDYRFVICVEFILLDKYRC